MIKAWQYRIACRKINFWFKKQKSKKKITGNLKWESILDLVNVFSKYGYYAGVFRYTYFKRIMKNTFKKIAVVNLIFLFNKIVH